MKRSLFHLVALAVLLSFALSGCNYFSAKKEIESAERAFAELKAAGGEKKVPYEYCSAEKFLEISKLELSHNDYKPSHRFAIQSRSMAEAGLAEAKKK